MKQVSGIALVLLLTVACGGDDSMASKSAAAYRQAQAKGIPVGGGHDHGGHQAATATDGGTGMDHAAHGTGADPHSGHDMTGTGTSDHAQHESGDHDQHAGMQHGAPAAETDPHAQHAQHAPAAASTDPHAGHAMPAASDVPITTSVPRSNSEMRSVDPSSTLRSDSFDAPAASAVSEAVKASGGGRHDGHDQHAPTAAAVYACPMHPEVTSDKPGTCPKCGMALVRKQQ